MMGEALSHSRHRDFWKEVRKLSNSVIGRRTNAPVWSLICAKIPTLVYRIQSLQFSPCNSVLAIQSLQFSPCNSVLAIQSLQVSPCNSYDPYHLVIGNSVLAIQSLQLILVLAIPTTFTIQVLYDIMYAI